MIKQQGVRIKSLLREADREFTVLAIAVTCLLTCWVYFGKQAAFLDFFPALRSLQHADFYAMLYEYGAAFICMLLVPFIIVRVCSNRKLNEYGLSTGDGAYGLRFVLISLPVVVLVAYMGSLNPSMIEEYPLAKSVIGNTRLFILADLSYLVYYVSWEFLFRGVLLFSAERVYGPAAAIIIQLIPSALVHIGKPPSESFGAIAGGLIFGFLALRTRSFLYPLLLHAALGISTDIFTALQR